ncbi:MAG: ABC transporter substrate-binding protein, partial [Pirellulaceae bacterium]
AAAGWKDTDDDGVLDGYAFLDPEFDGQINEVKRIKFEFTIVTSNRPDRILLCELLRENLDQIGIVCNVRGAEFTVLQQLARDHKFHAQLGGWGTGTDPDTSDNLWATKAIDSGRNYVCYTSSKIDELFQKGKYELDPEKRKDIYRQIHLQLYDDQPYTWLYFRNAYFAFNNNLRGVNFSARGPYNYGPGEGSIFKSPTAQ